MPHNLIEQLEPRLVMSGPSFGPGANFPKISLLDGTLTIRAGLGNDRISVKFTADSGVLGYPFIQVRLNRDLQNFPRRDVRLIEIDGGPGNDRIKLQRSPWPCGRPVNGGTVQCAWGETAGPAHILGGAGDDTIIASNYDDMIDGGSGDDLIFAMGGNDRIFGRAGNDTIDGDFGNDHVSGGAGFDRGINTEGSQKSIERITKRPAYVSSDVLSGSSQISSRTLIATEPAPL